MDKTELSNVLFLVAENFGTTVSSKYVNFLRKMFESDRIDIEQIREAAISIIKTKKDSYGHMPTYAEFMEFVEGSKEQIAEIEAQKVINLVRTEGAYGDPCLSPVVKQIIDNRFGGWKSLCGVLEESKLQWFIRDFKKLYLTADKTLMLDKFQAALLENKGKI